MNGKPLVCIIDYGLGNVASVKNALNILGVETVISDNPKMLASSSHLILLGVGSFGDGMDNLKDRNLIEVISNEVLIKKKKILGICLGMQLFATKGFEYGERDGLNLIPGQVVKIDNSFSKLRLPQIGWNNVRIVKKTTITRNFTEDPIFYFVHSYHFVPDDPSTIVGLCDYGNEIVSIVEKENIFGVQFHPEKSHTDGLQIFKNFLNI